MSIKVGDYVRSYDFPFDDESYIEGTVMEVSIWEHCEFQCGLPHIHILVEIDTFSDRVGDMAYPVCPNSGAHGFFPPDGAASKVIKVKKHESDL